MNRTAFSLPARAEYRTRGGLSVLRSVEQFTGGANRLDDLIELLDRRRGVVLSSGTTVPGRYESFDLGFSDPPLRLETTGFDFSLQALNQRGEVLIAFLTDSLREPCVVVTEKTASRLAGHILRGAAPIEEDQRTRRASVMSLVRDLVATLSANDDPLLGLFGAFAVSGKPPTRVLTPSANITLPDGEEGLSVSEAERRAAVARFLAG